MTVRYLYTQDGTLPELSLTAAPALPYPCIQLPRRGIGIGRYRNHNAHICHNSLSSHPPPMHAFVGGGLTRHDLPPGAQI